MSWLYNIPIRYKIFLIVGIALIGLVATLTFNYSATHSNAERLQHVRDIYFPTLERIDASLVELDKIKETLNGAASAGEIDMLDDADQLAAALRQDFAEIIELDAEVRGGVEQLKDKFEVYYRAATALTRGMIEGTIASEQIRPSVDNMTTALASFSESLNYFRDASYQRFTDTIDEANASSQSALIIGIIVSLICVIFVAGVGFLIGAVIEKHIKHVVSNLTEIASGEADLTKRLQQQGNDEIGQLVMAFNAFVEKLHQIIREVADSTAQLSTAAEEMSVISAESNENVSRQLSETEQVATAMNEMTSTVQEVARNAMQAAEAAENASGEANAGRSVVETTMGSINALANEVESASSVIQKLETDSENIGGVLDVIRGISEQTNLLALNAAIEAARAGEQGRGFAVVADEVRTLASRTQESTLEIQSMIESLQSGAAQAVTVMGQGREQAQTSVEQASKAGDSLHAITTAVSTISEMNTHIASAADEQSSVAEEINRSINNIGSIGEQTAQGAQKTAAASEEMTQLATQLQSMVSHFTI